MKKANRVLELVGFVPPFRSLEEKHEEAMPLNYQCVGREVDRL